jgi:hypothetical protein
VDGHELVARPGSGQFVQRARFGQELKPERVPAKNARDGCGGYRVISQTACDAR